MNVAVKYLSTCQLACTLIDKLVGLAAARQNVLIVALDGPDCSGKTTLARELLTQGKGRASIALAHFDDYLNEKTFRLRRGEFSTVGFREDYFDFDAFADGILAQAKRGKIDSGIAKPHLVIAEGLFLQDKRLRSYFDHVIRLDASDELILRRAISRDVGVIGDEAWVRRHYLEQCIPAQRSYREEVDPAKGALVTAFACDNGLYAVNC